MSQLANSERKLFRSLAGSPEMEDTNIRTLGTIKGVFAPVSLSMFSALLFLRMGYIVGNAGFLETVLLFFIAYLILVSTVFSICAIASNGAVKTGGVYFMLSRTMGAEFGGAVGILFYFANVVGSALYVTACVEGFLNSFGESKGAFIQDGAWGFPSGTWWSFLYCSAFNFANLCLCLIGAELFGKFSLTILVLVSSTGILSRLYYKSTILGDGLLYRSDHLFLPGHFILLHLQRHRTDQPDCRGELLWSR